MKWLILAVLFGSSSLSFASEPNRIDQIETEILASRSDIPAAAVSYAFDYFRGHETVFSNRSFITIIDFTLSSRKKRMHVIDLVSGRIEDYLVAHGKNSGDDIPTHFSNRVGSNMSSLGIYLTLQSFNGEHGLSMLLSGLESTNSNVQARAIIFHGAAYVSDEIAATQPRLGRSLGCPAVDLNLSTNLVDLLRGGSLIYAYSDVSPEFFKPEDLGPTSWNGEGWL